MMAAEELDPLVVWPADVERREDTLHLFGTDDMSEDDVRAYFAAHAALVVEWINDASCNVMFETAGAARAALLALAPELCVIEEVLTQQGDLPEEHRWRTATPHVNAAELFLRFATVSDVKPRRRDRAHESRYYRKQRSKPIRELSKDDDLRSLLSGTAARKASSSGRGPSAAGKKVAAMDVVEADNDRMDLDGDSNRNGGRNDDGDDNDDDDRHFRRRRLQARLTGSRDGEDGEGDASTATTDDPPRPRRSRNRARGTTSVPSDPLLQDPALEEKRRQRADRFKMSM